MRKIKCPKRVVIFDRPFPPKLETSPRLIKLFQRVFQLIEANQLMILIQEMIITTLAILGRQAMYQKTGLGIAFKLQLWKILLKNWERNGKRAVLKVTVVTLKTTSWCSNSSNSRESQTSTNKIRRSLTRN